MTASAIAGIERPHGSAWEPPETDRFGAEVQGDSVMSIETTRAGTAERNVASFRCIIEEGFGQGNLDVLDAIVASDFVEHQNVTGLPPGLVGLKAMIRGLRAVLPDLILTIEDLAVDGDRVWGRMVGRGTHLGTYFGLPGTGKRVVVDVIDICRFENGKMVEHWGVPDRFGLLEQLDLLPKP
jgi:predicted ester cyclase